MTDARIATQTVPDLQVKSTFLSAAVHVFIEVFMGF
jgi:hypothetical protein